MKKVVLFALIAILAVSAVSAVEYKDFKDVYASSVVKGHSYVTPSAIGNVGFYKYSQHVGPMITPTPKTSIRSNAAAQSIIQVSKINTNVQVPRRQQGAFMGRFFRFVGYSQSAQK